MQRQILMYKSGEPDGAANPLGKPARTAPVPALRRTALHCTALHCAALHCTAPRCTALHCTVLHCTVLHCTALHCTAGIDTPACNAWHAPPHQVRVPRGRSTFEGSAKTAGAATRGLTTVWKETTWKLAVGALTAKPAALVCGGLASGVGLFGGKDRRRGFAAAFTDACTISVVSVRRCLG
jgi:hypothetical protein